MSVFVFLCGNIGLTVNGDVNVVLFCHARCFFVVVAAASTVLLNGTVDDCASCCLLYCLSVCQSFFMWLFADLFFCCLSRLDLRLIH